MYIGDWLKFEERNLYCRHAVTILSGQKLVSGTVLGVVTASGKYVAFDGSQGDGRQTAAGILVFDVDASATGTNADTQGTIIARGPATINPNQLTWLAAQTAYVAAALASLLALGIVAGTGE
jgi:hypothetical protein